MYPPFLSVHPLLLSFLFPSVVSVLAFFISLQSDVYLFFQRNHGDAVGGPYIAVHMRRRDFLYGHSEDVPSIKGTAEQIKVALNKTGLQTVFIATDAPKEGNN